MDYMPIILTLVATGAVAGFLAGLMGIGGGIVTVPIMYWAMGQVGVPASIAMHMAVATSLLIIVPTAILSARSHHKKQSVDLDVAKNWGMGIVVGAIAGPFLAADLNVDNMVIIFGVGLLLMGLKLFFVPESVVIWKAPLMGLGGRMLGALIGLISSIMGIGGASFSVPALTFMSTPIHRAVGTASLMGLMISVPAVIGFFLTSYELPNGPFGGEPFTFGYFHLLAFIIIGPASVLMAPFGAHISHKVPKRALSLIFGGYLLFTSLRMLWKYLPI
jgi:uncharacterized membrane protein YfcA